MRFVNTLAALSFLAMPAMAEDSPPILSVTGEGQVQAAPDMATVTLGVTNDAESAKAALDANNAAVAAVFAQLAAAGIDARDIQTSGLTLGPRFDYPAGGGNPTPNGYTAANMVTVQVRMLDKVGGVLDAVVQQGANTLNGISFGIQDPVPTTDEARKAAVADAQRKAELYAAAAGVKLGKIRSISENGGMMPMPMAAASYEKAGAVPIAAGQMAVGASVSIVYELNE